MAVEAGPRPFFRLIDQAVFHRIQVDVVTVAGVIILVANSVLEVARLPGSTSSLFPALLRGFPIASPSREVIMRETRFD